MRAERRTVECATGGVRLLGGRRTDRGLVLVPQVRGWGSGRQDSDYGSGASVESSKQCPGGKISQPTGARRPARASLVLARRPRTSQSECSPAHQALNLSRLPDFMPMLLWFRGRLVWSPRSARVEPAVEGGLAGFFREVPFLPLVVRGIHLNFRIHSVQSRARKPSRNDAFSCGIAAF